MTKDQGQNTISPRRRKLDIALCAVLALAAGVWMAWKYPGVRAQRRAVAAVRAYGGWVHYDDEYSDGALSDRPLGGTSWLPTILGEQYFQQVVYVNLAREVMWIRRQENGNVRPADDVLAALEPLHGLKQLELKGTQATDEGLMHLRGLTGLERLYLRGVTEVTDAGAVHLAGLKRLEFLHLTRSRMTDAGLAYLRGLTRLRFLTLQDGHFSDAGLAHLAGLKELRRLYLGFGDGRITDAGLAHLTSLTALEVLDLQESVVTDEGLMQLAALPRLQQLWISEENGRITPEGIARLRAARAGVLTIR
jgi:hypothetical protein